MSLITLFILSFFSMMVNKETISVCIFLIYLMLFYGWVGYFYTIHKTDITQTCNKSTERHQSALTEHLSVF